MIRRVVCLCFLLQIWNSHPGVLGTKNDGINTKNESFNTNAWELVQADNEPIASLSDLSDGVFSLQLSAVQSDCETGTGLVFATLANYHSIRILF